MKSTNSLQPRIIVGKATAATGAFFLVLSFAMALLLPPFQTLGELLVLLKPELMSWIDQPPVRGLGGMFWKTIELPLLLRPDWLLPSMIGVVLVGIAAQLTFGRK